ncbi:hypothetical protein MNG54_RS25280 [Escherichia coli]|nr:hypothetical protein [Escherichia coli]
MPLRFTSLAWVNASEIGKDIWQAAYQWTFGPGFTPTEYRIPGGMGEQSLINVVRY